MFFEKNFNLSNFINLYKLVGSILKGFVNIWTSDVNIKKLIRQFFCDIVKKEWGVIYVRKGKKFAGGNGKENQ